MGNNTSFVWVWWMVDALCKRKGLDEPELFSGLSWNQFFSKISWECLFSKIEYEFILGKIQWVLIKGTEKLMVKIGPSTMSGMFEKTKITPDIIEEYFNGDWREGQEIRKVVITQRFYQTSPYSLQFWFSNSSSTIKCLRISILKWNSFVWVNLSRRKHFSKIRSDVFTYKDQW